MSDLKHNTHKEKNNSSPKNKGRQAFALEFPSESSGQDSAEYPVSVQRDILFPENPDTICWHRCESVQVLLITKGHIRLKTKEKDILLREDQGIFINQNQWHSIHPLSAEGSSLDSITFSPAFLLGHKNTRLLEKYVSPILSSPEIAFWQIRQGDEETGSLFHAINEAILSNRNRKFGYELYTKSRLCEFWYLLLQNAASSLKHSTGSTGFLTSDAARKKLAVQFIESRYREEITLDDISAVIYLSKSECCRFFKRTFGVAPFQYLLKYRVYESARLLRQREAEFSSISELAASVGFNSISYYNRLFKKYLDCTPLEYRKQVLASPFFQPKISPEDRKLFSWLF